MFIAKPLRREAEDLQSFMLGIKACAAILGYVRKMFASTIQIEDVDFFFFIWYKLAHTTSHDRFFFQKVAFRKGHPFIWGNIQVGDSFICF